MFISICNFVHAENDEINIYSPSAILIDQDSGRILYEKNIHEKMYPASLTKVLTAIIVLENCNLEEICTVSYDAVMKVGFGYVTANLQIGEELTVEQLLNLIMVSSSNDASHVLAEHVSGSLEDFAILMNKKAKELGCVDSNFTNPSGAHDENHYSSAYAAILQAIGLDVQVVSGKTKSSAGGYSSHVWVTVRIDGVDYLFDPQVDQRIAQRNGNVPQYYRFGKAVSMLQSDYQADKQYRFADSL